MPSCHDSDEGRLDVRVVSATILDSRSRCGTLAGPELRGGAIKRIQNRQYSQTEAQSALAPGRPSDRSVGVL
jgi:hypothetical protein